MNHANPVTYLRPPQYQEMRFIRHLWSDPDTMATLGGPILLTDEQAEQWFRTMIQPGRSTEYYCLIFNECDRPVGEISYHCLDVSTMTAELNLKIISSERGKGYATAAMQTFLTYFFEEVGGEMLIDDVALNNYPGQKLLSKFDFQQDFKFQQICRLKLSREQFQHLRRPP